MTHPEFPFGRLPADGLWEIPGSQDNVAFASLDPELFELLKNADVRQLLRVALRENLTITEEERRARLEVRGWDWLECEESLSRTTLICSARNSATSRTARQHRLRALMTKLRDRSRELGKARRHPVHQRDLGRAWAYLHYRV